MTVRSHLVQASQIAADLENLGVENMQPVITSKKTYIAPFVNARNRSIS